ncbi:hypothetical protein DM992_41025 (plasmid) [Burkholderia sp. JP2-270]|uniref:hypothetical protein n=1 Tax=Burkholderia sp. JP2-270 TaxID=2217913 RepID=UPI000DA36653|nr:hypothetical protein [Burkholderia sp. JP2-270]AWV05624.1 hypothetical protein DM992_41025 [Burkholderia sp. JP2-270]
MQDIELLDWQHRLPFGYTLTVADEPTFTSGSFSVYELLSQFQDIEVKQRGMSLGRYRHVALRGERAYVYDFEGERLRGPLGRVVIHRR